MTEGTNQSLKQLEVQEQTLFGYVPKSMGSDPAREKLLDTIKILSLYSAIKATMLIHLCESIVLICNSVSCLYLFNESKHSVVAFFGGCYSLIFIFANVNRNGKTVQCDNRHPMIGFSVLMNKHGWWPTSKMHWNQFLLIPWYLKRLYFSKQMLIVTK